jgi:hypothetical protein
MSDPTDHRTRLRLEVASTPHALARIVGTCASRALEVEALSFRHREVDLVRRGERQQLSLAAARLAGLVDVHRLREVPGAPPSAVRR